MKYRDFDRKRRYGIRKFAVGTASVLIGTVAFGVSPVLAQEQGNVVAPSTENVEKGKDQSSEEVPKEAVPTANFLMPYRRFRSKSLYFIF